MPFLRRHWPVLTLVLLPLAVLWRCVFLGETIGPWDQIMQMAPWGGPKPTSAWDVLQADGVLQFYPWRDLVFEAWGKGQLPLWNPYQLCGTPLLANSQSAGFYPLHILMGVLHVPTSLAITLLAWFHLAWAGLGARFLARQYGSNEVGAVMAGACFGLSAFMVSWTPLASVVTTCSWIPWVIGLGKSLVSGAPSPSNDRSDEGEVGTRSRATALQTVRLALACAMMLLGGHLQFAAYGFMGLVVVATVEGVKSRARWTSWAGVVGAIVLGGMLAAPQVLPVLAFSKGSHRQVKPTPEGAAAYAASAIGLPELTGFAIPSVTGLPGMPPKVGNEIVPSYWPAYVKRGAAFAEGALGPGAIALSVLFLASLFAVRQAPGALSLAGLGLLLALGPLSVLLYWLLPGWSSTGSPGRACVLFVLGISTLAAVVLSSSNKPMSRKRLGASQVLLLSSMSLPYIGGMVFASWIPGLDPSNLISNGSALGRMMVLLVVIFVTAALTFKSKPVVFLTFGIFANLLAGPLFCLPSGKPVAFADSTDPNVRVAFVNSNWGLLQATPAVMPGNTPTTARIHDVAGYDSLLNKDTLEMLRSVNGGKDPAPDANGNMMFVKPTFDVEKLTDAGVSEVWSLRPLPQLTSQPGVKGNVLVYRLQSPGRAFVVQHGSAEILVDGTDRQTIKASGPGTLVVKDRNMPGWTATVDGKPTPVTGGLWREIELPSGDHTVELRYSPPGLINGVFAAIVSALIMAVLLIAGRKASNPDGEARPAA